MCIIVFVCKPHPKVFDIYEMIMGQEMYLDVKHKFAMTRLNLICNGSNFKLLTMGSFDFNIILSFVYFTTKTTVKYTRDIVRFTYVCI